MYQPVYQCLDILACVCSHVKMCITLDLQPILYMYAYDMHGICGRVHRISVYLLTQINHNTQRLVYYCYFFLNI